MVGMMGGRDDSGLLYTIEGIFAAGLILLSAYVVMQTGIVPPFGQSGDEEMLLQQIADDALMMLATPASADEESPLFSLVREKNSTGFVAAYHALLEERTGATPPGSSLHFKAEIWYRDAGECLSVPFGESGGAFSDGPAARVSRLVALPENATTPWAGRSQAVLLEVLVWQG